MEKKADFKVCFFSHPQRERKFALNGNIQNVQETGDDIVSNLTLGGRLGVGETNFKFDKVVLYSGEIGITL